MRGLEIAIQSAGLLGLVISLGALAVSWFYSAQQLKRATEQAHSSGGQAKAAEQMAQRSLEQTEIMRAQLHAAFCPALNANGKYGPNCAYFTIRNIGLGPAFNVTAQYIGGVRLPLGNLEPGATAEFRFDNSLNMPQRMLGMGKADTVLPPVQNTPLRLEFDSLTGARCWTKVVFQVGGDSDGIVESTTEQGRD